MCHVILLKLNKSVKQNAVKCSKVQCFIKPSRHISFNTGVQAIRQYAPTHKKFTYCLRRKQTIGHCCCNGIESKWGDFGSSYRKTWVLYFLLSWSSAIVALKVLQNCRMWYRCFLLRQKVPGKWCLPPRLWFLFLNGLTWLYTNICWTEADQEQTMFAHTS